MHLAYQFQLRRLPWSPYVSWFSHCSQKSRSFPRRRFGWDGRLERVWVVKKAVTLTPLCVMKTFSASNSMKQCVLETKLDTSKMLFPSSDRPGKKEIHWSSIGLKSQTIHEFERNLPNNDFCCIKLTILFLWQDPCRTKCHLLIFDIFRQSLELWNKLGSYSSSNLHKHVWLE